MAVQFKVVTESAYDAWYRLTSPTSQIQAYVFDVIRSTVPRLELDEAFESKDDIAQVRCCDAHIISSIVMLASLTFVHWFYR